MMEWRIEHRGARGRNFFIVFIAGVALFLGLLATVSNAWLWPH